MGVKGEVNFVKVAGKRLLQGPVVVRSRLWDGEIDIATIPDDSAYLRVMSWVDVFDVKDTAAVRARYEEERARGGYEIPDQRWPSEKTVQDLDEPVWFGVSRENRTSHSLLRDKLDGHGWIADMMDPITGHSRTRMRTD